VTCWFGVPSTAALKLWFEFGASAALGGETLTTTCGITVTALLALAAGFAWLTTLMVIGFGEGTAAGAT